jgi:hypothetical protein
MSLIFRLGGTAELGVCSPADSPIYNLGHGVNAGFAAFSAILCFGLSWYYQRLNLKQPRGDGRAWFI